MLSFGTTGRAFSSHYSAISNLSRTASGISRSATRRRGGALSLNFKRAASSAGTPPKNTSFLNGNTIASFAVGACTALLIATWAQPTSRPQASVSQPSSNSAASDSDASSSTSPNTDDVIHSAIEELRLALPFPNGVDVSQDTVTTYGSSENSYHPSSSHAVVVRPRNTEDVVKIVNISRKWRIPVVPYSGGTSLEGHFSGIRSGSICLDMSTMDRILDINEGDGDMTVQAGVRWEDVNDNLKAKGIPLFFPLDPGPGATIGGMIGTGCSGTNAVRYGTAKAEWFLNVTVVLPSGEVIKTRSRARKSSAGFDTTKLFIGAEGTLGIVTEATLRLAPLLPYQVATAQFPDVGHAVDAVQEILNSPYGPHLQCIELADTNMMHSINNGGFVDKPLAVSDTLFFKIQGAPEAVALTADTIQAIVQKHGSTDFQFASSQQEAENLWSNRKYALMSTLAAHPGCRAWTTDVCVPVSNLPRLVSETKQDVADSGLHCDIIGHVGDGNFHAIMVFKDEEELKEVRKAVDRLVRRALSLEGTCTGEHGVGIGKKEYLVDELGAGTVALMKQVKAAIDPLDLMNPGKLYPDDLESHSFKEGH